jgi:hypothetical protein
MAETPQEMTQPQEAERPTGTIDLLTKVKNEGPATLTPLEARRVLDYLGSSERSRGTLQMRVQAAEKRAKEAQAQLVAFRAAAATREAELEQQAAQAMWRARREQAARAWDLLEAVDRLYREGAGPEEWAGLMGKVGAAVLGGG